MNFFLKIKRGISSVLILAMLFSFSPLFFNMASAQGQAAISSQGAGSVAAGTAAVATPAGSLAWGSGYLAVSDYGVRVTTLQILASSVGVGPGTAQRENIWNAAFYMVARIFLRQLTQSIVEWINSGFQGNPSFLQNPEGFMENLADRTIGEFIFNSDLNFLCDPFKINVKLALGLQYAPFKDSINCRLSEVFDNVEEGFKQFTDGDFIGGGGWDTWLSITTVPQNNQLGAMLIAQAELEARISSSANTKQNELNQNGGFLSLKDCERTTIDYTKNGGSESGGVTTTKVIKFSGDPGFQPVGAQSTATRDLNNADGGTYGTQTDKCKVTTPGTLISDQMNRVSGLDTDALNMAEDINQIVGALANFVISKAMQKGFAAITKDELDPNNSDWRQGIADMQAQVANAGNNYFENPSYIPSYNNGGTGNGSVNTQDQANIQNAISANSAPEQAYYLSYLSIYNAANSMEEKFLAIKNCLATKPSATQADKNTASSTISLMSGIKTSIYPNIVSSQNNLGSLQIISNKVDNAVTAQELADAESALSDLLPTLHDANAAAQAKTIASSTIATIIPNGPIGDTLQAKCNALPN